MNVPFGDVGGCLCVNQSINRTKSLLYHPDKLKPSDDAEFAGKMFHLLQLASVTLGDAATRIKYDDLLRAESNRETRLKGLDDGNL